MQALERDLSIASLTSKIIYLNLRCGNDITAAKSALIFTNGPGLDVSSGSFSAWSEASGLAGTTGVMDTGVNPSATTANGSSNAIGIYLLNDVASNSNYVVGDTSFIDGHCWGLIANNIGYFILDSATAGNLSERVQSDATQLNGGSTGTKGFCFGSRYGVSSQFVARNGVVLGVTTGGTSPTDTSALVQTRTMKVNSARGVSGGEVMATGLTPDDASNLTWIMHTFNVALSRGVTADGLF